MKAGCSGKSGAGFSCKGGRAAKGLNEKPHLVTEARRFQALIGVLVSETFPAVNKLYHLEL